MKPVRRVVLLTIAMVMTLIPATPGGAVTTTGDLFISELHYDNDGTDVGEFFEIEGPAGTDLSGWTVLLYNGSNGTVYGTVALSGVISDESGGRGAVAFPQPVNGIQNGSPDGLALVDPSNVVVEFLSYEGSFTGVGGAADGLTSTDIGVSESSGALIGESLQVVNGVWTGPASESPGSLNLGAPTSAVFISELHYDNAGTDVGEFFEIEGPAGTDLSGWTVLLYNGSNGTVYGTVALSGVISDESGGRGAVAFPQPVNGIQNGSPDGLALVDPSNVVVEFLSYEGSFTGVGGAADGLTSTDIGVSESSGALIGESLQVVNGVWTGPASESPGSLNLGAPTSAVFISELHYDNAGTDVGEFFEIEGPAGTDLSGWTVLLYNGSNGTVYGTVALSGVISDESGGRGAVAFPQPVNGIQNGSPDGLALVDPSNVVVEFLSYEGSFTGVGGAADGLTSTDIGVSESSGALIGESLQVVNGVWTGPASESPGLLNTEVVVPPTGFCGDPATLISAIQGDGSASPLVGQTHTIEGVVVGDFQDVLGANGDLNGFFVQEEDAESDGNPATSEGIFVFQGSNPTVDVANGDLIRVVGPVSEFFDATQISATAVLVCGPTDSPTPATVTLPVDSFGEYEAVEGMSIVVGANQDVYISEYFNFDRFGEIVLTPERLYQPTAVFDPGSPDAAALAELNARSRLTLDDGRSSQNPDPARHPNGDPFTLDNRFRGGDILRDVVGVMDYSFGLYRIQPTAGAAYVEDNPRPATPDDVGGSLTVASFNVLNYFNTIDDGVNDICGPLQDQECRGADNENERTRQLDKIVSAMAVMDADVLGIIEVENTTGVEAMADIVDGLNAISGSGTYDYIDTGTVGSDAIKVGFIYQPGSVTPVGDYAVLDDPAFVAPFGIDRNRAALAQTFLENATGGKFTAVVNHLKSKGSPCGPGDDDPEAGSCNLTRTVSAQVLADWLATDPTGSDDPDVMIIGDLNSYDKEDPIDVLIAEGYVDLLGLSEGEFAYSYVFDSQLGYLDYGMANASLASQVTGTTAWHINADEPDLIDYDTSFKQDAQDAIYAPDAYRSSDHDPVIVGLDLNASPSCEFAEPSIDSIWPPNHQMVDIEIFGCTDAEGDAITITIDSIFQDEPVNANGDGNTAPDGDGIGTSIAQVRAERSGEGDGRVYHIAFTATDAFGNTTTGEVTVEVRLSRKAPAVDGGALFDSTIVP